ncbi:Uncharacterized protein SCF082_LOCUS28489 [Durusdinium trenchii]|uniref:Pyrrolo-quinoline quinone repeat domain-containing protein n=1 Tax=Durusdinium trenchii TaxID=1381693 RepID=A0ABP0MLM2_9DINO
MFVVGACLALGAWSTFAVAEEDCEAPSNILLQTAHQSRRDREMMYHWPNGRGRFPYFAVSEHIGPFDLNNSLSWSWHHPEGRFHTLTWGVNIDHEMNVYLSAADGFRKFDMDGKLMWERIILPRTTMNTGAIYQGKFFASDTDGGVEAVDMKDGSRVWYTKLASAICEDNGFNMVHQGVLFAAADCSPPCNYDKTCNQLVKALNATTGKELWTYKPDTAVWNFLALFPDMETVVFQDMSGKVYKLTLNGDVIWKAGGLNGTWTDGGAALGPNGMVYAVNNNHPPEGLSPVGQMDPPTMPGQVTALDVVTGDIVWQVTTPRPPNNAPAVGKVQGWEGLSLVVPLCQQVIKGAQCDVHVYNAKTGALRWVFHGPTQKHLLQAGDAEGTQTRIDSGVRSWCLPNGWSAPTIAADGVVFVGNEDGLFFALRDSDGDGRAIGVDEVRAFDTKAAFSGSSSPALAPQMVAVASCDSLFVFKN